jgi:hypothetical protein
MRRIVGSGATLGLIVLTLTLASAAWAKDGDLLVQGACSGGSSAKLKLSPENGRTEVEFEVDQNRNGVAWRVVLMRSGVIVSSTTAITRGPSGSFEARRVIARGGLVRAVATRSGERCSAQAAL